MNYLQLLKKTYPNLFVLATIAIVASSGKANAQQDPFTLNGNTLTLIANPNASYSNPAIGQLYFDSGSTYTVTLNPTSALTVSSSMAEPLIRIGDGTTNNSADANVLTTNSNFTLQSTAGGQNNAFYVSGILVGTNGGTISSTGAGGVALGVDGILGQTSSSAFTNNGTLSGSAYSIIATNIGYFVNSSTGSLVGKVNVSNGGTSTITYFSNAGSINGNGQLDAIQADVVTTFVNSGSIGNATTDGIYVTTSLGTLTNSGHITGGDVGLNVLGNGNISLITNQVGGVISGVLQSGIESNENILDLENYGSITGGSGGNGIGAFGGTGITTLNNYMGATISGFNGVNGSIGTLVNNGTIQGNGGDGLTAQDLGSITNGSSGTIEGEEAIHSLGAITSLTNAGTITGNGGVNFSGIDAGSIGSFTMTAGSVTGGLYGIRTTDGATLIISGGTISGGSGSLFLNASTDIATSSVTINGGANIEGLMKENTGVGTLTLNLIGLSPTQKQALEALVGQSSGTFDGPGGDVYSFDNLILQGTPSGGGSLLVGSVDRGLQPLAAAIDANGLPSGPQYDAVIAAATSNPELALQSLSGREIDSGLQDIKININNSVISQFDNQLDNLINAPVPGGIDFGSLSIGSNQMIAYNDTTSQLKGLLSAATMSDVAGTEMGIPAEKPDMYRWGVWACGTVSFANESQRGAQAGYNALYGTPTIGLSYRIDPNLTVGALANYTTAGANFGDGSKIDLNSELFGVFAEWNQGPWRVHGLAAGGVTQYDNQRVTLDNSTASSSPDGSDVITDATGGYEFKLGNGFKITPQLGVQYTHVHKDAASETGSDLGLNVGSQDIDSLRSHLGFVLTRNFQVADKLQFIPELRAAWYHEYMDGNSGVNTSLQSAPALGSFAVTSVESPQRDYALLGVGLNTAFTGYHDVPVGLFINYDVQAGQASYIQQNVSAGIRVAF